MSPDQSIYFDLDPNSTLLMQTDTNEIPTHTGAHQLSPSANLALNPVTFMPQATTGQHMNPSSLQQHQTAHLGAPMASVAAAGQYMGQFDLHERQKTHPRVPMASVAMSGQYMGQLGLHEPQMTHPRARTASVASTHQDIQNFTANDTASRMGASRPQHSFPPQPPSMPLAVPTLPMAGPSEGEYREALSTRQRRSPQWAYGTSVGGDLSGLTFSSSHSKGPAVRLSSPSIISGRSQTGNSHRSASSGSRLPERVISRQSGPSDHGSTRRASSSTKSNSRSSKLPSRPHIIEFNAVKAFSEEEHWKRMRPLVHNHIVRHYFPPFNQQDLQSIFDIALEDCRITLTETPASEQMFLKFICE